MSDIEVAELKRKEELYHATMANIKRKLHERFTTLREEYVYDPSMPWYERDEHIRTVVCRGDPEMNELSKLRVELEFWFHGVIDYYALRNNPEMDPFIKEIILLCSRYRAVMAWAMRRRAPK